MSGCIFTPADLLLPRDCEYQKWSVVACDQYTSQPEYWLRVEETVGKAPSALRLVLPEGCLDGPNVETDIMEVNNNMSRYLRDGRFTTLEHAMIYVERTLHSGAVRRGIVGKVDLEQYDYEEGARSPIRATEGTVLTRLPPRVALRKNAPLELSHTMLLFDDPADMVLSPLAARKGGLSPVYDFDLMEEGGHLRGWLLDEAAQTAVQTALNALLERSKERGGDDGMLFAVGDGNHTLAAAKESYERQRRLAPPERRNDLPARYALVEIGNLRDEAQVFRPIHRLITGCRPEALLRDLVDACPGAYFGVGEGHVLHYTYGGKRGAVTVPHPAKSLEVETLQPFLDEYVAAYSCGMDYIHGTAVAEELSAGPGRLAFLLPAMDKNTLFPAVRASGVLPRKTFSMGEARDKRFYLEARKIR